MKFGDWVLRWKKTTPPETTEDKVFKFLPVSVAVGHSVIPEFNQIYEGFV